MGKKILFSFFVWLVYRLWSWTWRTSIYEPEPFKLALEKSDPFIIAHWHGDELVLLHKIGYYRVATMTSTSKDGELMDGVIRIFGGITSRGSSTRGAVRALKGLIELVKKKKRNPSMAVDGPKGPIYQIKPGVFEVSRLLDLPIYVAGIHASDSFIAKKSWNKAYLPKPFAKVGIYWLGPIAAIDQQKDPRDISLAEDLKLQFDVAKQHARKLIDGNDARC